MRICIYYFLSILLSILLGISFLQNKIVIFIIALIFLLILILRDGIFGMQKMILVIFSLIGFLSITNYYSVKDKSIKLQDFRVVSKISNDLILKSTSYDFKKYIIKDYEDLENINEGMLLNISGRIVKQSYYDIGVVGEIKDYTLNNFRSDFLYKFYNMRSIIRSFFVDYFGEDRGNILLGLTFGDTSEIDKQYKNSIKSMGLSHI